MPRKRGAAARCSWSWPDPGAIARVAGPAGGPGYGHDEPVRHAKKDHTNQMTKKRRRYWLMKSEPDEYSIDDLERDGRTAWEGVRNYQARNIMRDEMSVGDLVLFYHSNAHPPGAAGVAEVCRAAYPDATAWAPQSPYYDPRSSPEQPVWVTVEVAFIEKFARVVSLEAMRRQEVLHDMLVLRRGVRLSVQPIRRRHFMKVRSLGRRTPG